MSIFSYGIVYLNKEKRKLTWGKLVEKDLWVLKKGVRLQSMNVFEKYWELINDSDAWLRFEYVMIPGKEKINH